MFTTEFKLFLRVESCFIIFVYLKKIGKGYLLDYRSLHRFYLHFES